MGLLDPPPFIPNAAAKSVLGRNGNPTPAETASTRATLGLYGTSGDRLRAWDRRYQSMLPLPSISGSPPTMTFAVNPTLGNGPSPGLSHPWDSPLITQIGTALTPYQSSDGVYDATQATGSNTTLNNGFDYFGDGGSGRVRFRTDSPEFEIVSVGTQFCLVNLTILDESGSPANDVLQWNGATAFAPNAGGTYYTKVAFGAFNAAPHLQFVNPGSITTPGTGYVVGDIITVVGGTGTAATYRVVSIGGGGAVSGLQLWTGGDYTVVPTAPLAYTGGSGTGLTTGAGFTGVTAAKNKMRTYELAWTGGFRFRGLNLYQDFSLYPCPIPLDAVKVLFLGDSQTAGTYLRHATSHLPLQIARRLGFYNNAWLSANGGTGWDTVNAPALKWSDPRRIADIVRINPDVVIALGSQNDAQSSATQTAVTSTLNALTAQLPNSVFIGTGSVLCTLSTFLKAGWAAANNQDRLRYINNVDGPNGPWFRTTAGKNKYMTNDNVHFAPDGTDAWADTAAPYIADAMRSLKDTVK